MPRKLTLLAIAAAAFTLLLCSTASAFSFAPAQTVVAGLDRQNMNGVAAGDIDNDGLLDAVSAGYTTGAFGGGPVIAVLRGRANGTLGPAQNFSAQSNPNGIALGDFDDDGFLDAALAMPSSETLGISLNDGEGRFLPPTQLDSGGGGPEDQVVADFDGDGDLDVASANATAYSVYLNEGDGSFAAALNEEIEDWALTIASGDFDADGVADLALGNVDWGTVRILLGDGDGSFTAVDPVDLDELAPEGECWCVEVWGIEAGDLDGNGRDDLVVTDRFENRLFSVLSNSDDTFTARGPFPTGNEGNPIAVALGDLDADGHLDAATADYLDDTSTVLAGDGAGNLTAALSVEAGELPRASAIADVGGDGKPDLLFADEGMADGEVTLVGNAGQPTISLAPDPIDFGAQAEQMVSPSRQITVTNGGDARLHVSAALLGGANASDFLASADDCFAAPVLAGQSCTVAVRFVPAAPGPREGSLVVHSDAPGLPAVRLAGVGTALNPGPAGPAGPPGPAGPAGRSAPLVLVLAQKKLSAVAGKRVRLSFATTLPGRATLTVKRGPTVRKRIRAAGTRNIALRVARPGTYNLKLAFRAGDGQQRTATAKLVVSPG